MTGKGQNPTDPLSHLGALSHAGHSGAADSAAATGPNTNICGDFDIRIGRDGTWFYHGSPIGRKPLVRLFASVLRRDGDRYVLVTPVEKCGITVEEAPFLAVELLLDAADSTSRAGGRVLRFRTNVDDWVTCGLDNPLRFDPEPATGGLKPFLHVRQVQTGAIRDQD